MPNYNYYCEKCDEVETVLCAYDDRDEEKECAVCGMEMPRTFQDAFPTPLRASHPDGYMRFNDVRTANKLKREQQKAKARSDFTSEKKAQKELNKLKGN